MNAYTPYEQISLREARATFADPFRTPVSALVHVVDRDVSSARGSSPVARMVARCLDALFELTFRTIGTHMVFEDFRHEGLRRIRTVTDVRKLELWEVDEVADPLVRRYLTATVALVVFAGGGLAAPLSFGLAARAIGDVAFRYGFDPRAPGERRFARDVLVASLTPASSVRSASLDQLLAAALTWSRRRDSVLGVLTLIRLVRGLLRAGLSQPQRESLARVGTAVAAAANVWLLVGVIRAARSAYRERFIARHRAAHHRAR